MGVNHAFGILRKVIDQILKVLQCGRCTVQTGTLGHTDLNVYGVGIGLGHKLRTYKRQQEYCTGNQDDRAQYYPPALFNKFFKER